MREAVLIKSLTGVECTVPDLITRSFQFSHCLTLPILVPIADDLATSSGKLVVQPRAEQKLNSTSVSSTMAESLFKTHVDPTKAGFESTLFSLICHDAYALKARFDAV